MSTLDVYRITNELDDASLEALATRLEARGRHPRFVAMLQDYLEAMAIDGAHAVLDVGCGTGFAARAIARRPGFTGHVFGIDRSAKLVSLAAQLAGKEGLAEKITFDAGDSQALEVSSGSMDAVIAHTLMSHVEQPGAVLAEIVRTMKPGAKVGIFDGDYASMTFASDDPATGKATDEKIIGTIVTNARIMREMPALLRSAGLELVTSFAYVVADIGKADFWASSIQSMTRLLPRSGAMTEAEAADWASAMFRRSDEGTFFGASNYYGYVARKATR